MRRHPAALTALSALAVLAVACTSNDDEAGTTITVSSTADACVLSADEAAGGTIAFEVTNDGDEVTEFYLLSEDGSSIIGEVEDIGPGTTRTMRVDAEPGAYLTACKPGMVGDGIRAPFTVADSGEPTS